MKEKQHSSVRRQTPEERELEKKRAELAAPEAKLAQRELDLATLKAELHVFERRYLHVAGARYAELDEIMAQIAEAEARRNPKDEKAQERAAEARAQAEESAQAAGSTHEQQEPPRKFKPSDALKKLFRELAKLIHPDYATDEKERERRHRIMAEANQAYEDGDEERLRALLHDWESSPESVEGEGLGAELIRIIRKIAQVEERLSAIEAEIKELKASELYQLKTKVEEVEGDGRDLLAEMAAQVDEEIAEARERLEALLQKRRANDE